MGYLVAGFPLVGYGGDSVNVLTMLSCLILIYLFADMASITPVYSSNRLISCVLPHFFYSFCHLCLSLSNFINLNSSSIYITIKYDSLYELIVDLKTFFLKYSLFVYDSVCLGLQPSLLSSAAPCLVAARSGRLTYSAQ
jgi:hypothetical protein